MDVFHITGTPKARVQYFCAVSRKKQAFLKAYRRRSCLHNQTPKQFWEKKRKSLQEDQRPLIPFSVVDGVCLGKIGHEIYATETWRIDLSLSKPSYLEIHNSYSSACSFSSYFFFQQHQLCLSVSFSLTQWHLWQNSAARGSCPTPPRQRADEFTGTSFNSSQCICNVPSASCCTFWSCTLCNPDMLVRLISNCIFIPGCYHDIILRKCSGKINFYSSAEMFLYCLISDFR